MVDALSFIFSKGCLRGWKVSASDLMLVSPRQNGELKEICFVAKVIKRYLDHLPFPTGHYFMFLYPRVFFLPLYN